MYKVVIVDDEPIICEGLKQSVRWSDFGCEVAGTAANGLEGLELMRMVRPDILISDISMNNMDGLSMVAALLSEFPDVEVSLLTGYRNFEYAQQAIKLGVTRFLLKPSRMDEIEEAITAMTENLRKRGNTGEQIVDSLWDLRDDREAYIYRTFIRDRPEAGPEGRARETEANRYVLKKALLYMLDHYTDRMNLSDVAGHCYVSSWHLSKLLNRYTGKGFYELVNHIRLDEAGRLLRETGRKIQDIAETVGFRDVAHFSRLFKAFRGVSPKEYRQTRTEEKD